MGNSAKRVVISAVAGIGAGIAVKKTRTALPDTVSPFASALLLAVVGVVAQQAISTALTRAVRLEPERA
jgi:hypothetical protein